MAAELSSLPFPEQLDEIERALSSEPAAVVLERLAVLRDHEPLTWLVVRLGKSGALSEPATARALRRLFGRLPDAGIHRVLRGVERAAFSQEALAPIVEGVADAVRSQPIERLAAVCLMDRWLKNAAPKLRAELAEEAFGACSESLKKGSLAQLSDTTILRVPGVRMAQLGREAAAARSGAAWAERLEAFGARLLEILEGAPKSLSQANAEEILSRRVYTDPGHFFFELLQNAEDAGATRWSVEVGERSVSVWHDGTPFDGKDVVGVLSIGQTTKQKGQIGFFGIGFKSVYEICERPQLYSGPFNFEIADVSVPRRLGGRPGGSPAEGTLLVLPLRDAKDPLRTPEALHGLALALPARLLLTLTHLKSLGVRRAGRSRTLRTEEAKEPGRVRLVHEETGQVESYLVETERFCWALGRDVSKSKETPVLVAVALDAEGAPMPLEKGAPTLFSYLPTGERSGLRYLVHAHFDLPIDRERLDLESLWNRWALACSADLLSRVVLRLASEAAQAPADGVRAKRLEKMLEVLPLPEEVEHPAYRAILDRLAEKLSDQGVLRGAAGERLAPGRAALLEDASLVAALAGVPLDPAERRALQPLQERARKVARALGATVFGSRELVALLSSTLAGRPEGAAPSQPWLASGLRSFLDSLGRAAGAEGLDSIASLPLLPDQDGQLWKSTSLSRAEPELRAVYGGARRLLEASLDLQPRPGESALLEALAVPRLSAADLVRDLAVPSFAQKVVAERGAGALFDYLSRQNVDLVASLGRLSIFPDDAGALRPLVGEGAAWRPARGSLGAFTRAMTGARPPLVDGQIAERFGSWLSKLGARTLGLSELLAAIRSGEIELASSDVPALHRALDEQREDLTPRQCEELASTAIFPDESGELRPLRGEGASLLAQDDDVQALLPTAPWLDADLAALGHISRLGVAAVGAEAVVRALLGEDARLGLSDPDREALRRCYGYLGTHADLVPPRLAARLVRTEIWLDVGGDRRTLDELRLPPADVNLARLYAAWGAFPLIDEEGAAALAHALGLGARLVAPDHSQLVRDLVGGPGIDVSRADLRPLLVSALAECANGVSPSLFGSLAKAPIFRGQDGRQRRIAPWDAEVEGACYRVAKGVREALAAGSRPLLGDQDESELAGLLDALKIVPAGARELVQAVEEDAALRGSIPSELCRKALASQRADLSRDIGRERLEALVLWPTRDGRLLAASDVVRGDDLADAIGQGWEQALGSEAGRFGLLHPSAEPEARALAGLISFRAPVELIAERIRVEAKPGAALAEQPEFLRDVPKVLRMLQLLWRVRPELATGLPLAVDAAGRLVSGPLLRANADEILLAEKLPLRKDLADPTWAEGAEALDPKLAPPMAARRLLQALHEVSREAQPLEKHPVLAQAEQRARLYAWLLSRAAEIDADEQARGVMRKACVVASAQGWARAPLELLCDAGLPELGIDWNAAPEVPQALVAWIRRAFHMDEERLLRLVDDLVERYTVSVSKGETKPADDLLRFLARTLTRDPEGLPGISKRLRLHKRLKVEAEGGGYVQPHTLLAPEPERWALIAAFAAAPPPRLSARYQDAEVRSLIEACGASRSLAVEDLTALLKGQGLKAGAEAALAFARYLGLEAAAEPKLRHELKLDRVAWIPDGTGKPRPPKEMHWPDSALVALVGEAPERFPHPEFIHAVPAAVRTWLPFKDAGDASLDDVVMQLRAREPARPEVLDWLERGVASGRLDGKALREKLGTLEVFEDDDGVVRASRELLREDASELFGSARGSWVEDSRRYPRLAAALEIPSRAGPREVLRYLDELARRCEQSGPEEVLAADPELAERLPRCLERVAAKPGDRELPARLPLAARDPSDRAVLCLLPDSRLRLAEPEALAEAARAGSAPVLFPILPPGDAQAVVKLLRELGVRGLWELWSFELPAILPKDVTEEHESKARDLSSRIRCLWEVLPRVRSALPDLEADRWRFTLNQPPLEVRIVEDLVVDGSVAGANASLACDCAVEARARRTLVDARALKRWGSMAEELVRRAILSGVEDERVVDAVAALLEAGSAEKMTQWLDAHSFPGRAAPKPEPKLPPRPVTPKAPAPPKPAADEAKFWPNVKKWLFGEEQPSKPPLPPDPQPTPPAPPRRPDPPPPPLQPPGRSERPRRNDPDPAPWNRTPRHAGWMRPERSIRHQLESDGSFTERRQETPEYGFAFAPTRLPVPYLYGPKIVCERFERRGQRWLPTGAAEDWPMEGREGGARVVFRGRAPAGQTILPVPMYARVAGAPAAPARLVAGSDGRPLLALVEEGEFEYEVSLDQAPVFDEAAAAPEAPDVLLERTVPDDDLPAEALDLVEAVRASPGFERVGQIRAFIRDRYKYDPGYLEDAGVGRWLSNVSRGRANEHLAALHAGRDARYLGRGVCYELNVLACELLRRAGVPAAICTGWTFESGQVSEPDHLWATALVPSDLGPRWMPVDASTTRDGIPLHASRRPPGPWRPKPAKRTAPLPKEPRWREPPSASVAPKRPVSAQAMAIPAADLIRVAQHLAQLTGEKLDREEDLRRRCLKVLEDPVLGRRLLELLRGG
ncbi:MAG TPA: transglutaminase domain-containing protein [Myxococcales bacterium]|jgi:hypothetical protein